MITDRITADGWSREGSVEAGDLEEVLSEHNLPEGLVLQEHVDGARVGQLSRVVGNILHAPVAVRFPRKIFLNIILNPFQGNLHIKIRWVRFKTDALWRKYCRSTQQNYIDFCLILECCNVI